MRLSSLSRITIVRSSLVAGNLIVAGCAGSVSTQDIAGYDSLLARGDYAGAAKFATAAGQIAPDGTSKNLLWSLDAGAATVFAGQPAQTIPLLDHAEDMMRQRDLNENAARGQYTAKTYDAVMVNAYKAIAAMQNGQSDLARTELLRADDRQRRAEDEFQAEAAALASKQNGVAGVDVSGLMQSAEANGEFKQAAADMANFGGYRPFVNPFATYLTGLYFLNTGDGDRERARNAFQRVRGIVGPNPLLDADYALANGRAKIAPKTWVIVENGQGSTLSQYNVVFPVPIVGKRTGISTATVAMPRLHENAPAVAALLVGDRRQRTLEVGNFDYVMRSEFQRRYKSILTAAVIEAALKIVIQNAAAQEKSGLALLAAQIGSNISTTDVRSWSVLPKDFQVARIDAPKNGQVPLMTESGAMLGTATVPSDAPSIVYVKALRPGSPPSIQVLRF